MINRITTEKFKKLYISKLKNSPFNRFFIFEFESYCTEDENYNGELFYLDGTGAYRFISFDKHHIEVPLYTGDVLYVLFETGKEEYHYDDMIGRSAYAEDIESMTDEEFWNFIYELTIIFAGAYMVDYVKKDIYKKFQYFDVNYYDIYVNNCYSKTFLKQYSNITIHVNDQQYKCADTYIQFYEDIIGKTLPDELNLFLFRYEYRIKTDEKFITYYNDIHGDFYSYNLYGNSSSIMLHCRDMELCFNYDDEISSKYCKKMIYEDHTSSSDFELYKTVTIVRILFAGAGNISYEERKDGNGNSIGYNIYVEKEYDETYTKKIGNFVFHVNDGYQHKNETERLEDFLKNNVIKEILDIPGMILHPLQTTKASRFLCYKLVNDEIKTLYFNGKDGDFYLKANRDSLLLHCRDMAFVFGNHGKALNLVEEGDLVINYVPGHGSEDVRDIFTAAYGMIYSLAGAGTVTHKASDLGQFVITIEKEYIEADTKKFGNIIFEVRQEIPEYLR